MCVMNLQVVLQVHSISVVVLMFVFVCHLCVIGTLDVMYVQYVMGCILFTKHLPEKQPDVVDVVADVIADVVHIDLE